MNKLGRPKKPKRVGVNVTVDPDLLRRARLHRVETRETVSDLVNRLLSRELLNGKQEPAT